MYLRRLFGALLVVIGCVSLALPLASCNCDTYVKETPILLDEDELDTPCETICGEIISQIGELTSCTIGSTKQGEPIALCTTEEEYCGSGSHF